MTDYSISSGQTSNGLILNAGDYLYIYSGGIATNAIVNSGAIEFVASGGNASGTVVSSGGTIGLGLSSGSVSGLSLGIATGASIVLEGVTIQSGAIINELDLYAGAVTAGLAVDSNGVEFVLSGGIAGGTTVNNGGQAFIASGGVATGTTVNSGGSEFVFSGGNANGTIINSGGTIGLSLFETVSGLVLGTNIDSTVSFGGVTIESGGIIDTLEIQSGGVASNSIINSGATEAVYSGGNASGSVVESGGIVDLGISAMASGLFVGTYASAATVDGVTIQSGGILESLYIYSGGVAVDTTASASAAGYGDTIFVESGGVTSGSLLVNYGAGENIATGGIASGSLMMSGGVEVVQGGVSVSATIGAGGREEVFSGGMASASVIGSGGIEEVFSGGVLGNATIADGGALQLDNGSVVTAGILFSGSAGTLIVNSDSLSAPISGFSTDDRIDLQSLGFISAGSATIDAEDRLTVNEGNQSFSLQFSGDYSNDVFYFSEDNGGTSVTLSEIPCFCRGTLILTPSGETPVETLAPGDLVRTLSGVTKPIRWIGKGRTLVTEKNRTAAAPIVIVKDAITEGVPARDLRLTKGHALYLDGVLIPAEFLVNYRSIYWDTRDQVLEFYHIELEDHDILIAENTWTESYREDGNRHLFHNIAERATSPHLVAPYAPVLTGGVAVDHVWRRLLDRAGAEPMSFTADPDLHLLVDGVRLDAEDIVNGGYCFRLEAPPTQLRIVSRTVNPAKAGLMRDPRCLGVALRRVLLAQRGAVLDIPYSSPWLAEGFNDAEPAERHRWTTGDAILPARLFCAFDGPVDLELHIAATARYPVRDGKGVGLKRAGIG